MVTMVKSSDSELPVLDFSRARNFSPSMRSAKIRDLEMRLFTFDIPVVERPCKKQLKARLRGNKRMTDIRAEPAVEISFVL